MFNDDFYSDTHVEERRVIAEMQQDLAMLIRSEWLKGATAFGDLLASSKASMAKTHIYNALFAKASRDPQTLMLKLTKAQRNVLRYILGGKESKEIGPLLNISFRTVDVHRRNIHKKCGTHDKIGLVAIFGDGKL